MDSVNSGKQEIIQAEIVTAYNEWESILFLFFNEKHDGRILSSADAVIELATIGSKIIIVVVSAKTAATEITSVRILNLESDVKQAAYMGIYVIDGFSFK